MDAEQYNLLLDELKSGVRLLLGPEFCRLNEEESINESLRDFIAEKHSLAKTYVNEDGFFYSDEIIKKNSIIKRISEFTGAWVKMRSRSTIR